MPRSIQTMALPAALLTAVLVFTPAVAATVEEAYIAARDAAIAKVTAATDAEPKNPTGGDDDAVIALDTQALAELEQRMRAIVGPVEIKGLDGESAINLDTLNDGDEGFGLLDGMVYGGLDAKTRVIVTTEGLFRRWLQAHQNWAGEALPRDPSEAIKDQDFYSQAVLTDAAIVRYAELPITAPAGATFASAMLAARTQSDLPAKADEIFIALDNGGRVYIADTTEFDALGPIPLCDTIRADLAKKSAEAVQETGSDDGAAQQKSDALSAQSDADFLRCFADKAAQQSGFAGAAKAAQALLDRLPAH
ncbi:MAG: hypothetical protein WA652_22860 [Xanthobacteraceae bacterium]